MRRWFRRIILAQGKRVSRDDLMHRGMAAAWRAAISASLDSSAYQELLREHGLTIPLGRTEALATLPVLTKENTFARFPIESLARPIQVQELADVLTSSGRGSHVFGLRIADREQYEASSFDIDLGLQDAFAVDSKPTLLVNCLPMGVIFRSEAVAVANVSVREDMACAILRHLGPRFEQTLVCSDPLFIKRLLDHGNSVGIDWRALNTSVILGEEMLAEAQREYIALKMGIDLDGPDARTILSSFGVGELGLNLLFETRETIRLRRAMRHNAQIWRLLGAGSTDGSVPSVFCFNPLRCFVEVIEPGPDGYGELCFTMTDRRAGIPLPRYTTGDVGKLVSSSDIDQASRLIGLGAAPWLPVVMVKGRAKDRKAGMPSVESVKESLYSDSTAAERLTGAFRIADGRGEKFRLVVQTLTREDADDLRLAAAVKASLDRLPDGPFDLELCSTSNSPWACAIDYERKFRYVDVGA
jgi:phenylacetate-CoA ligase